MCGMVGPLNILAGTVLAVVTIVVLKGPLDKRKINILAVKGYGSYIGRRE